MNVFLTLCFLLNTGHQIPSTKVPVSVAICCDNSGSIAIQNNGNTLRTAYSLIVNRLQIGDSIVVIAFGEAPRTIFGPQCVDDWGIKTKLLELMGDFNFGDTRTRYSTLSYYLDDKVPSNYCTIIITDMMPATGWGTEKADDEVLEKLRKRCILIQVDEKGFKFASPLYRNGLSLGTDLNNPLDSLFFHLRNSKTKVLPDKPKHHFRFPIVISLIVLIALIGVYFLLRKFKREQIPSEKQEKDADDADTLNVLIIKKEGEKSTEVENSIPLSGKKRISIGSGKNDNIFIDDPAVVSAHLEIFPEENNFRVKLHPEKETEAIILPYRVNLSENVSICITASSYLKNFKEQLEGGQDE